MLFVFCANASEIVEFVDLSIRRLSFISFVRLARNRSEFDVSIITVMSALEKEIERRK